MPASLSPGVYQLNLPLVRWGSCFTLVKLRYIPELWDFGFRVSGAGYRAPGFKGL